MVVNEFVPVINKVGAAQRMALNDDQLDANVAECGVKGSLEAWSIPVSEGGIP